MRLSKIYMRPPRIELGSPTPQADTLSVELRAHYILHRQKRCRATYEPGFFNIHLQPAGIEPTLSAPEADVLSVELRLHQFPGNGVPGLHTDSNRQEPGFVTGFL
jgi:hypothetical protein